ncbi:MAG: adenylosuccinate synthase [Brevinemataceae bacterium]
MPVNIIVGTQWGDEGKGKVIDSLAANMDYIIRFGGGNNAGHTVNVDGQQFILHLLPSGVLHKQSKCLLSAGVVFDPFVFLEEIQQLEKQNFSTDHIFISSRAHMIMPYHILLDQYWENLKGKDKIGTTKRGIGPCYSDKFERIGLRVGDLSNTESFAQKLKNTLNIKNKILKNIFNCEELAFDKIYNDYIEIYQILKPRIINTEEEIQFALAEKKKILLEGAQAAMLDIDYGHYPYVTSSSPTAGGACTGTGISPKHIDNIIGVCKAYSTRVGEGPFVTELTNEVGDYLRKTGGEYGATTQRPRRCGWLDIVAVKHAVKINGLTSIALTKLDILSDLDEIPICVSYTLDNKQINYIPASIEQNYQAKPNYEIFPGWKTDISLCRTFEELPENTQKYILKIEELTGCRVSFVSTGMERSQYILR